MRRRFWPSLLWLWASAVALLSSLGTAQTINACNRINVTTASSEVEALRAIYRSFLSLSPGVLPGWAEGGDPCGVGGFGGWRGVVCQSITNGNCSTTVSGLQLTNLNLKGSLATEIQNLTNLSILSLTGNPYLVGRIPSSLGNLTNLVVLDFHDNGFNGSLPPLDRCKSLLTLDLSGNNLDGPVPEWLGNLTQLQRLDLSNNQLNGSLPIFKLRNLKNSVQITFSNNKLTGTLDNLSTLSSLRTLNLSNNHFNGTFPLTLFQNDSQLAVLDLSRNEISGLLPNMTIPGLQQIYMAYNKLNGNISSAFLNSPKLEYLSLDYNQISGTLDLPSLQNFSRLQVISLSNNSITDVGFPAASMLSAANLTISNLLFLSGNAYCSNPQTDLLLQICRSNPDQSLIRTFVTVVQTTNSMNRMLLILVIIASSFVMLVAIISMIEVRRLLKKIKSLRDNQQDTAKIDFHNQPMLYSYTELKAATEDFSEQRRLGQGGFGVVFKGVLNDGTAVAVKQLIYSEQTLEAFLNEVVTISSVRHPNLVSLKGCCVQGDKRVLVYEYVENNNLADALWDSPSKGGRELDWSTRFNIIVGVARGLIHLHQEVNPPIIHRDIKASNILLDAKFECKIGDFGLALLFPTLDNDRSHLSGNLSGTKGYLAPEYVAYGQVSEESDAFSFGILVLEIISGRKSINLRLPAEQRYILEWAWKMYEANTLSDFIDPKLVDRSREEEIKEVMKLGLACVLYAPERRPKLSDVVSMMLGHLAYLGPIRRDEELSKEEVDTMFATVQESSLTRVDEDIPLLDGLPTASATGAFIELGKLKPR